MEPTTLKQLGCLILAIALLAGCAPSNSIMTVSGGTSRYIIVEGTTYDFGGHYWKQNGKVTHSHIVVFPFGHQHYFPAVRHPNGQANGEIYYQELTPTGVIIIDRHFRDDREIVEGEKIADVAFGYVYFVNNKKIVFQKSYEELGIDISDPKNTFSDQNLLPILETLIRENVPPQEPEMEEEL